ncbi:MAG: hypothetical protein AAB834_01535, partial [Patescibacteria group bacterium]
RAMASGQDQEHYISKGTIWQAIMMHVDGFAGPQQLREDLSDVSAYIQRHDTLNARGYVAGVTYRELSRVAIRAGFRGMDMFRIDPDYLLGVEASHLVYCALNGRRERPFEPAMVYLPTQEFQERFAPTTSAEEPAGLPAY